MRPRNLNPTSRQEAVLRDVLRHPGDSLAPRAERLGLTRGGVHYLLHQAEARQWVERGPDGKWVVALAGRKWLRPTMGTRR